MMTENLTPGGTFRLTREEEGPYAFLPDVILDERIRELLLKVGLRKKDSVLHWMPPC